jgi:hypothetical protein
MLWTMPLIYPFMAAIQEISGTGVGEKFAVLGNRPNVLSIVRIPTGIRVNRTKHVIRWKATGQHLSPEAKADLVAQAEQKRYARKQAERETGMCWYQATMWTGNYGRSSTSKSMELNGLQKNLGASLPVRKSQRTPSVSIFATHADYTLFTGRIFRLLS